MKKLGMNALTALIIGIVTMTTTHAQNPLWTLSLPSPQITTLSSSGKATVTYTVTNQSSRPKQLVLVTVLPKHRDYPTTPGLSSPGCVLPATIGNVTGTCILTIDIDGSQIPETGIHRGPYLCEFGSLLQCYEPSAGNRLQVNKKELATAYTLGGTVVGLSGTVVLATSGGDTLTINSDGRFNFSNVLLSGAPYQVIIEQQPTNQTCTITNGSGSITQANITNVTVNCSTNAQTIGGNISGLADSESVVLQDNASDNLTVNRNGSLTFSTPVAQGAPYNVTILMQPTGQICTVNNGRGIVGSANITTVQIICSANTKTVGGTITGLSGTVVLQDNNGDDLTSTSNGLFIFATPVAKGASYSVTVAAQPTSQRCTVTNGNGTIGEDNITNVSVNCVTNTTTLSISVNQLALSVTGLTEYGITGTPSSGSTRMITITNTGNNTADNVVIISPTWPTGTSSTTTCQNTLAVNSSCTITITPGSTATATSDGTTPCSTNATAPVPGSIQVSANNAATVAADVVVLSYGCIYQGGYIYALDDTTPTTGSVGGKVLTTSDQTGANGNSIVWASNGSDSSGDGGTVDSADTSYDQLPGIDDMSTATTGSPTYAAFSSFFSNTYTGDNPFTSTSFSMCNGALDGACNTENILTFYNNLITNNMQAVQEESGMTPTPPYNPSTGPTPPTYYAAGLCTQSIANYSDWYLPAICEMGYDNVASNLTICGTSSVPTLQNIQSSLVDFNNLNLFDNSYWSSTEDSIDPLRNAYYDLLDGTTGSSYQQLSTKYDRLNVRCSRVLTF